MKIMPLKKIITISHLPHQKNQLKTALLKKNWETKFLKKFSKGPLGGSVG